MKIAPTYRSVFAIFAFWLGSTIASLAAMAVPANPAGFVIHRGTNLSHWLSQDDHWAPRETWITETDIRFIADQGFDHVRLPVDEKELWSPEGRLIDSEVNRLLAAIDWCRKANLRVIVDLHTVNAHHFNAENEGRTNTLWTDPKAQDHFIGLWRDLSARLRHVPVNLVAYEILNEAVADLHEDWNKLAARAIKTIRAAEPNRVIVLGANRWQIADNMPFLEVPAGDKNIILSFHTYVPMLLTHYKADWVPTKNFAGAVTYPGPIINRTTYDELMKNPDPGFTAQAKDANEDWNAARLRQVYQPAIRRAKELGLQLYCGEFGCLPTVPRAARLAYYRDIVGNFESDGIAWANWEYKGDFGVYEWRGLPELCGKPDEELLRTLLPKK